MTPDLIGFPVLTAAIGVVGYVATSSLWRALDGEAALRETTPLEMTSASALTGGTLWLMSNWILALTHTLTRVNVMFVAVCFVLAAIGLIATRFRVPQRELSSFDALVLAPLALWIAYICWRGSVLPPDSHDVLSYHLPKAVFMARAHGYGFFITGDSRISSLPANYELLLSDVLLLAHSDRLTEWIGTVTYLLFLVVTGAVVERWWGRGRHTLAVIIATAATPVLLLHSGADKNDLMAGFLAVVALMIGARWYARGGSMPWLLLIVALAIGGGTKAHEAVILIGLAPFIIARVVRRGFTIRDALATVVVSAIAFFLGGGAAYIVDLIHPQASTGPAMLEYGDWGNLWRFPFLLLTVPFSPDPTAVWVPWRHQKWFWPRYEIYFSEYGVLLTALVVLLPFAIRRYRAAADQATRRERFAFCIAAVIAFVLVMPVKFRPLGFFAGFTRYVIFVIPAVMAWTLAPFVRELVASGARASKLTIAFLPIVFMAEAIDMAKNDRFSPFVYALEASQHPGMRSIWFNSPRAGVVVDRLAGPFDTIAVDGGFDTWMYPAMGAHLTRRLVFIPQTGPVRIPDDAQWVIIDRSWNSIWGSPNMKDLGGYWDYIRQGTAKPEELRVYDALLHDPHWILAYDSRPLNQAIFRRLPPNVTPASVQRNTAP